MLGGIYLKHRIGIIGYGAMAGWHHDNSKRIKEIECVAAYDIDPERLKVAKEKGIKAFSTLESFFSEGNFDIVLVATPNNFHRDFAIMAMEKGKHVVCEKPVAMSSI